MSTTSKTPEYEFVTKDCIEFMEERWSGRKEMAKKPRLVIVDPPYNFGKHYDVYDDDETHQEFCAWCYNWLKAIDLITHPNGSVWVVLPDELVSHLNVYCLDTLGWHQRGWIVWYYTFGQCNQGSNFSRSHTHLLYYTMKKTRFTFNEKAIRVPSARQLVYGDKRAASKGKMADDTWMLLRSQIEEVLTPDQDVWLESRINGNADERQPTSPNQIPLAILNRIVLSTSNPGDLVFDPFSGSGSSVVAAVTNGRRGLGVDVSAKYNYHAKERVKAALVAKAEAEAKAQAEAEAEAEDEAGV